MKLDKIAKPMEIKYIPVDEITPYEKNPRINDNALDALVSSIEQFGFKQPLVLTKDKVIIVGHTRLKAAKKLGLDKVPCVIADLTKEQADAYRIVDNKSGEESTWDWEKLGFEYVKTLEEGEVDMTAFEFDIDAEAVIAKLEAEANMNMDEGPNSGESLDEHFKYECPECGMRFN
ncbi:MAG: ParB N-terminal domain-containing protein [Clostridia bacterium]|nr:ParB N-terminal domain-containing protein [Clostridia bacterium]